MRRLRSALAAAGMFATLGLAESASAATYTVDDADDVADAVPNDGVCDAAGPDDCTLRAAVQTAAAVGSSGDDLVELPFDVTLTLGAEMSASGNGNLTIRGTGVGRQTVDAADASRVLNTSAIDVTLEDLLLTDGEAEHASEFRGGAIHFSTDDDDVLHLENTRVESSESVPTVAGQAQGGGIYVTGDQPTLSMAGSEVVGNTAGDGTHSGAGGGIAIGGANVPTVVASNSVIDSNVAAGGPPNSLGGGLYVAGNAGTAPFGSVTLTNSNVSENSAGGAGTSTVARGGGIYLDGAFGAPDLSLLGTTDVDDNEAGGGSGDASGEGGGVMVDEDDGTVTLNGATIQNNSAGGADELADGEGSGRGGGLYSLSDVDATDATFLGNEAGVRSSDPGMDDTFGSGGAILVDNPADELSVSDSLFQANRAGTGTSANPDGGAIRAEMDGPMAIAGSSFLLNQTRGAGGAIGRFRDTTVGDPDTITNSRFVQNSSRGDGGGLHSASNRPLTISGAEFSLNSTTGEANARGGGLALGAISDVLADPLITVRNTTISQNAANGATGIGGGLVLGTFLASVPTEAQLTHLTVVGNSAGDEGGNLWIAGDGADDPTVNVRGSIVADGTAPDGADCFFHNAGDLIYASEGGSVEDGTECDFSNGAMGDDQNADPMLAALADNGDVGQSGQTMALSAGSPAIDNVAAALCAGVTTDQRGYSRPSAAGAACDSGAYELFVCNGSPLNQSGAFPGCTPPPPSGTNTPITTAPPKKKKCKKGRKLKRGKCVKKKRKKKR